MPTEIELKLRLPPNCVSRLRRHPSLKSPGISRPVTQKLLSVYYDTPDLDLQRLGAALRLRRIGRRWVQTIKGGGSVAAGLHQRDEWEAPVLKQQPDFTKITDPVLVALFSRDLREQLRPAFITEFTRSTRLLRLADGDEVEFCLDRGEIITDNASEPLCEIELELKSGNPVQLFRFALDLLHFFPLRLENTSKAARGYALCSGSSSLPTTAMPVALDTKTSVNSAFKAITWNCLGHLHANETGMLANLDIEYLHQMRVALRRLCSALSTFSAVFSKTAFAPAARELKWLLSQFGPARDWDVFVVETLAEVGISLPRHPGLLALRKECERLRLQHGDVARSAVKSARYTEMMLRFGVWLNEEPWLGRLDPVAPFELALAAAPAREFAQALLAKRHRQLIKRGQQLADFNPKQLHALRIAAKKQRYAAEFFAALYPRRKTKSYIRSLSGLQNILGAMNDGASTKKLLDEIAIGGDGMREAAGIVLGWSTSLAQRQRPELEQAWKQFSKQSPFWTA